MLIQDDGLNVNCEETVYEAVVRWIEHKKKERSQFTAAMMSYIRFPLMRPPYLRLRLPCAVTFAICFHSLFSIK